MKKQGWIAVAVIAAVPVLALAVPALMDWSRFKAPLIDGIEAATGRKATIAGPIGLRLLPAPAATVRGLSIANPGNIPGNMVEVERVRVHLAVLPLLTGTVRVTAVELDRPVVALIQTADGRDNWSFGTAEAPPQQPAPAQRAPRIEPPAAPAPEDQALPVDEVIVNNGTITYGDGTADSVSVTDLVGRVLLGGRSGPFKANGAAKLGGTLVSFDGAMDSLSSDRAAPLSLTLGLPGDDVKASLQGLVTRLSGGETLRGHLSMSAPDPRRTLARLGLAAPLPAGELAAETEISVSETEFSASDLTASLGDQRATGSIAAKLGAAPQVDVRLAVAALDLDKWQAPAGDTKAAESSAPAADDGKAAPKAAGQGGFSLPKKLFASANLSVEALSWHGQVVREARLEAVLDQGEMMVRTLTAQLPGNSVLNAEGTVVAQDGRPGFDGSLRVRSDNLRSVLAWAGVDPDGIPDSRLRNLDLSTPVRLSWPELRLPDFRLTLDSSHARGALTARLAGRPALGLSASVDSVNADAYLPKPAAKAESAEGKGEGGTAASVPGDGGGKQPLGFDADLAVKIGSLMVKGVAVEDVAANALLQAGVLEVREVSGEVAGSRLTAQGRVLGVGQDGQRIERAAFQLNSPQPSRLFRAFGSEGVNLPSLRASGTLSADATGKVLDISGLSLTSGATSVAGQGRVDMTGAKPAITAELTAGELTLDTLLGGQRSGFLLPGGPKVPPFILPPSASAIPAAAGAVGAGASPFSREPIDLSALDSFNARIGLKADAVTAKGWRLDTAVAQLAVQDGTATLDSLTGKLQGGDLKADAKLASAPRPAVSGTLNVTGSDLSVSPLELGGGLKVVQGVMNLQTRFTTSGASTQDMAAALDGDGSLQVRNGVLDGFDLPAVNQRLGNIENIGSLLGLVQAGLAGGRTPFSQLSGTFKADKGVVTSRDLKLEAQGGGASAQTTVDLPRWTTNTAIAIQLASASQTPLGIRLEGPLENPRKIVDVNALQQHLVQRGLGRALKGMEGQQQGDKPSGKTILRDLLKGLGGQ